MSEAEYLTVQEALTAVLAGVSVLPAEQVPLLDALGRVLAQDVVAQNNLPPSRTHLWTVTPSLPPIWLGPARANPATLRVIGNVAAGAVQRCGGATRNGRTHHDRCPTASGCRRRRPCGRY
ncbi:MAG: hypothetical protein R3D55_03860 [Chloroflexota bacterium]